MHDPEISCAVLGCRVCNNFSSSSGTIPDDLHTEGVAYLHKVLDMDRLIEAIDKLREAIEKR